MVAATRTCGISASRSRSVHPRASASPMRIPVPSNKSTTSCRSDVRRVPPSNRPRSSRAAPSWWARVSRSRSRACSTVRAWTERRRRGEGRTSRIGLLASASCRTAMANICASTLRATRVVRPLRSTRVSASSTTPVLASVSRRPPRRGLMICDSAFWYPAKVCNDTTPASFTPPLPGRRSPSLLAAAPHPVLPQLLHGHVRLGSTKPQGAPLRQSLLQRHLGLTASRPARLDQTSASVEVAYPHCGEPLLRGTTGDRTDPDRSDLAHSRATTQRRDLPVLDVDPRLVGERSGNYAAKRAGWPIAAGLVTNW